MTGQRPAGHSAWFGQLAVFMLGLLVLTPIVLACTYLAYDFVFAMEFWGRGGPRIETWQKMTAACGWLVILLLYVSMIVVCLRKLRHA
jgi:hypothetical protein